MRNLHFGRRELVKAAIKVILTIKAVKTHDDAVAPILSVSASGHRLGLGTSPRRPSCTCLAPYVSAGWRALLEQPLRNNGQRYTRGRNLARAFSLLGDGEKERTDTDRRSEEER